jgi:hypothetical protein
MSKLQKNLVMALDLSRRIVELAGQSAWTKMAQLDRQRLAVLESIFNDSELKTNPGSYDAQVQRIVDLNNQAVSLCTAARGEMSQKGRKLKVGKDAIVAYSKHGPLAR